MTLIDTHAHLDFPEFTVDFAEVLSRAEAAGVQRIITIGTSLESSRRAVALAASFPNVFAAIGVHPNAAMDAPEDVIGPLRELARHPRVVAIGETGLDYHRLPSAELRKQSSMDFAEGGSDPREPRIAIADGAIKAAQAAIFEQQLDLAAELGLNVIVHERDAWDDALRLLGPYSGKLRAVFHCFGKSLDDANTVLSLGHLVSFTGIVTFKNAAVLHETAAAVPEDSFMVETDCPYLAPVPHRGKRCEPAFTRIVAEKVAMLRGRSLEDVAARTSATAEAFFRFARER